MTPRKIVILLSMFLFVLCFWIGCVETIDAGHTGILFRKFSSDSSKHGSVEQTVRGWVVYNGFISNIYTYPTFIQRKTYAAISVNAKDASIFRITPTIAYRLNPDKITDIFVKYRKKLPEIETGYLYTAVYDAFRLTGNEFTADSLMSNRGVFEQRVRERLTQTLEKEGFIVEEFTSSIEPPESLRNAIDSKNEAVQHALKADNEVKAAEARAKIAAAKAQGFADSLMIAGKAEADYNKMIAASLNEQVIKYYSIEKWNGILPQVTSSNSFPIIGNLGRDK